MSESATVENPVVWPFDHDTRCSHFEGPVHRLVCNSVSGLRYSVLQGCVDTDRSPLVAGVRNLLFDEANRH
jgi:hypothetical protein